MELEVRNSNGNFMYGFTNPLVIDRVLKLIKGLPEMVEQEKTIVGKGTFKVYVAAGNCGFKFTELGITFFFPTGSYVKMLT